jgi:hypothetical protein
VKEASVIGLFRLMQADNASMSYAWETSHPARWKLHGHSWRIRHQTDSPLGVGDAGNGYPTFSWTVCVSFGTSVPKPRLNAGRENQQSASSTLESWAVLGCP